MFEKGFKLEMNNVDFLPTKNVTLQLLDEYNQSIKKKRSLDSIIYGKNGSGKSTICKAINSYLLGINRYETKLLTSCDEEYDETSTKNIKIYSEFFIDNNVKFKSIGLDTIILLGESVEVDKEIEENEKNLKEIEEKIKSIDLSVYEDSKNALNPSFNINKMIKTLKTDGCWATRQKHINGTKNNPIVNEQTISNIFDNHDKEIKLSLFNEKLKEYIFVKENATIVNANLLYPENVDLELIKDKLSYKVSKNSNDSLAEEIYKVINIHGESRVQEIHTTLSEDIKTCPYCFQSIDSNYKKEVLKRISDVLSKDGEELKTKLNNLKLNEFYQVEIPTIIEDSVKNELYVLVKKFNESIKKINEQIAQKIDNVYESYELQVGDYLVDKKNLVFLLDNIHDKIKSHNENVKKIKNLKTDLSLWNNYISWPMIEDEYQIYIGNEKRKKKVTKEVMN